jgi:hypothetical protein
MPLTWVMTLAITAIKNAVNAAEINNVVLSFITAPL